MKLDVIQISSSAINSIYIYRNFLEDLNKLNYFKKKIEKLTEKDEMQRTTNVKASMTSFNKLIEDNKFEYLHKKILETLSITWMLRTPHPENEVRFEIFNSWGMKHKKGDFTLNHIHMCNFSCAFYMKVPKSTYIKFDDFERTLELEENMLLLFPGYTKHSVFENNSDDYRISMSSNINIYKI